MTFSQQISGTLIGTLGGFIFSLILFYLTEKWRSSRINKDLADNIQREIQYNIDFLGAYKEDFEKMLRNISADQLQVYTIFKHNKLQRLFILEAFQKGLLYKKLTTDEINDMDAMLNYFAPYNDTSLFQLLNSYTTGQSQKGHVLPTFEWHKDQIDKYIKVLKNLKDKLKKLK